MSSITILGCGWLGRPLAQALIRNGHQVKASCTTEAGVDALNQQGITAFKLALTPAAKGKPEGDPDALLRDTDTVIISIPPRSKHQAGTLYLAQIQQLSNLLQAYPIQHLLFISTTGVYASGDHPLTEQAPLNMQAATTQAEHLIRQTGIKCTVLRFAGLVGPERNPGRFLAGKHLDAGETPVNLIHQADCIGIISQVIEHGLWGETLNACADQHPIRADFYTHAAQQMGLPLPQFQAVHSQPKRYVDNHALKQRLGYQFIHPDLMHWLDNGAN